MDKDKIALDFINVYKKYKEKRLRILKAGGREADAPKEIQKRSEGPQRSTPDRKS